MRKFVQNSNLIQDTRNVFSFIYIHCFIDNRTEYKNHEENLFNSDKYNGHLCFNLDTSI